MKIFNKEFKIQKVLILTAILSILSVELLLRIFYYEQLKVRKQPEIYKPNDIWYYDLIPNAKSVISLPSIEKNVSINSLGFNNKEFSPIKDSNTFRIIFVGSSTSEGIWLDGQNSKNYVELLEKHLASEYRNIEVINCSLGGFGNDYKIYLLALNKVINYNADLLMFKSSILFAHWDCVKESYNGYLIRYPLGRNEVRNRCIEQVDWVKRNKTITRFYDASYIFRAICRKKIKEDGRYNKWFPRLIEIYRRNECNSYEGPTHYFTHEVTFEKLNVLKDSLEKRNTSFYTYTFGENYFENISGNFGINAININLKDSLPSIYHKHDGHPNALGHMIIAQEMFNVFVEKKLVPDSLKIN